MFRQFMKTAMAALMLLIAGCSPGLYTRMDASAPSFGPVIMGMSRADAERYLGHPIYVRRLSENRYEIVYEYQTERSARDTLITDVMDFMTFGMGSMIISPVDRFCGIKHLMSVNYEMTDCYRKNDRVIALHEKVELSEYLESMKETE